MLPVVQQSRRELGRTWRPRGTAMSPPRRPRGRVGTWRFAWAPVGHGQDAGEDPLGSLGDGRKGTLDPVPPVSLAQIPRPFPHQLQFKPDVSTHLKPLFGPHPSQTSAPAPSLNTTCNCPSSIPIHNSTRHQLHPKFNSSSVNPRPNLRHCSYSLVGKFNLNPGQNPALSSIAS